MDKKEFKHKLKLEKDYKSPIKWAIDIRFKDILNKKKKEIIDFMFLIADSIQDEAKKKYEAILNDADNGYIKIEQIPNYEDIFGSIEDMIKSNLEMVEYEKKKLVKLHKKKNKLNNYDEIKSLEMEIIRADYGMQDYQKEVRFLKDMKGKIIRESKWKFQKHSPSSEKETKHGM